MYASSHFRIDGRVQGMIVWTTVTSIFLMAQTVSLRSKLAVFLQKQKYSLDDQVFRYLHLSLDPLLTHPAPAEPRAQRPSYGPCGLSTLPVIRIINARPHPGSNLPAPNGGTWSGLLRLTIVYCRHVKSKLPSPPSLDLLWPLFLQLDSVDSPHCAVHCRVSVWSL